MKTVIITGANRGIGLETALSFGRAGYKVFATMRNTSAATSLKRTITEESLPITILTMDVDSDNSVKLCIDSILDEHGSVDVLVNNAGIERHGSVEELTIEDFKSIMETNYFGTIRCIKSVLTQMREKRNGCIINISSVAGHIASSPMSGYAASKYAVEALSEVLAQEVKPFNIRVAIVEPGIIDTDMARGIQDGTDSMYPHLKRFRGLFAASLQTPTSANLVASKIIEIAEENTSKLKHPVGPDAEPFLAWRASMSDEEWVDWNAASDEEWYAAVARDFGLDAKQH